MFLLTFRPASDSQIKYEVGSIDIRDTKSNQPSVKDVVSMEDLLHSLRNALRNEVGLFKVISAVKLKDLKMFLSALVSYFPADRREILTFLMKLKEWLDTKISVKVNFSFDSLEFSFLCSTSLLFYHCLRFNLILICLFSCN